MSEPIVYLFNAVTKTVTDIVVANGGSFVQPSYDYSLAFTFPDLAAGHTVQFLSCLDGNITGMIELDQPPYVVNRRQPIHLSAGDHRVAWGVKGGPLNSFRFTVLPPVVITPTVTTYYVDPAGDDGKDGLTLATAWKTPRVVSNAGVRLSPGGVFQLAADKPLEFAKASNASVVCVDPTNPATLLSAVAPADKDSGPNMTIWSASTSHCLLSNVVLDSTDGKGFGGIIRGVDITLDNITFHNLNEGFQYQQCNRLTIRGGGQTGKVTGRCHYLIDVIAINWQGDRAKTFGPSIKQSPIRFSSPGVSGGVINDVIADQTGSQFPIATWAIHNAQGVTFNRCTGIGGEVSLNPAGDGIDDKVVGCTFAGLITSNTKLNIGPIASGNTFTGGTSTNPTGECITVNCLPGSGNKIINTKLASPKHGIHFGQPSDLLIQGISYDPMGNSKAPMVDGCYTPANIGTGNVAAIVQPIAIAA